MRSTNMIIGLDISTSTTGYTLLTTDGIVAKIGHISLGDCDDIWTKADMIREWARDLHSLLEPMGELHIFIEQSLQAFRPGFSSAATLSTLTRFNGIVSYIVREEFKLTPEFIGATTARSTCGIKVKKGKANGPGKEQVFRHVTSLMLIRDWPTGRTGKVKDYCYDEVDSYVIAEAGRRILNSRQK